ncbi:3'(2'),5'-bisphosphate nucleotidase CysQ [Ascidiaceihabitans sp.]|nr:3'(2'),5'-bisphosphate nucleotidase CysQ [Ascidiaceihabitans sp.]
MKTINEVISKYPYILKEMQAAAIAAGNDIMDVYAKDEIGTEWKADDSPLTLADLRAHKVISERLMHSFPDIQLFSEEDETGAEITVGDVFFLVDPLDGTKEFIKRTGEFTVNIALVIQGITKLGVVHLPAQDTLYATTQYDGAVRIRPASKPSDERELHKISVRSVPEAGPTLVMSASHSSDETREYCALYKPVNTLSAGSSLKFCKVAEGKADYYPRLGRTMEWDTAAAHAVLKAAGVML